SRTGRSTATASPAVRSMPRDSLWANRQAFTRCRTCLGSPEPSFIESQPRSCTRDFGAQFMARCELGYLCEVCGEEVGDITDSDLYLRYVLGEVDPELLHLAPERHLRCNPVLSQFVVDDGFDAVVVLGPFSKDSLDPAFVAEEETRVTAAYRRLREIFQS